MYKRQQQDGWGVHIGMRGQLALASYAYLYLEPRVGLMEDQVSQAFTWHGLSLIHIYYNICLDHERHIGDAFGAGLTYGYSFSLRYPYPAPMLASRLQ